MQVVQVVPSDDQDDWHPTPPPSSGSGSGSRPVANRLKCCACCGKGNTPMWRNGPMGPKMLCNACGIRYLPTSLQMSA
jgi:hypothetical protein